MGQRIYLLLFLLGIGARAQERLTVFWQPAFAVNYKVTETYTHNFSLQNRNFLLSEGDFEVRVRQLDAAHFSKYRIRGDQSLALGVLYRFREGFDGGANELRLTQQYNRTTRPFVLRYGHRLRTEQRITKDRTTHRFRYRFSLDRPLQGEKLDIGEPYLVANSEGLLSLAKERKPQYDARFTVHLGWKTSEKGKFQMGLEYRTEDFSQDLQHVLFLLATYNVSL